MIYILGEKQKYIDSLEKLEKEKLNLEHIEEQKKMVDLRLKVGYLKISNDFIIKSSNVCYLILSFIRNHY